MPILIETLNSEVAFSFSPESWKLDQAIDPIVEPLPGAQLLQAGSGNQSTSVLLLFSMTDLRAYTLLQYIYIIIIILEIDFCRTLATLSGQMKGWERMIGKLSKSTTRPLFP